MASDEQGSNQSGEASDHSASCRVLIAVLSRKPGEDNGNPLQYSCLENPMEGGACRLQSMGLLSNHEFGPHCFHIHFSLSCIGEGNGNPLQYSCLENPKDRGACWAAIYGVTQSRTRLTWLSSSSRKPRQRLSSLTVFWLYRNSGTGGWTLTHQTMYLRLQILRMCLDPECSGTRWDRSI